MRKRLLIFFLILLGIAGFSLWFFVFRNAAVIPQPKKMDYAHYPQTLDSLRRVRKRLADENASLAKLERSFIKAMDKSIFTYWYGTKWDFNGTTEKPNEGKIACGYFVTTTLRDAGVKINRVKMAQCASEEMIKSLVAKESISRFSNLQVAEFEKKMNKLGKGLYVIGLDNHTGFILISDEGNYFIHASGWYPYKVVKEILGKSSILDRSRYKIVGKLSNDKDFLKNWIQQ